MICLEYCISYGRPMRPKLYGNRVLLILRYVLGHLPPMITSNMFVFVVKLYEMKYINAV